MCDTNICNKTTAQIEAYAANFSYTVPPPFQNTDGIEGNHQNTPRFGYPNDINLLINGSADDGKEYLKGALVASFVIFVFFLGWFAAIILLKCTGARGGFLSGRAVTLPRKPLPPAEKEGVLEVKVDPEDEAAEQEAEPNPQDLQEKEGQDLQQKEGEEPTGEEGAQVEPSHQSEYAEELAAWEKVVKRRERRLVWIRVVALMACLFIVIASVLMISKGSDSLLNSVSSAQTGLEQAQSLAGEAISLIDCFFEKQGEVGLAVDKFEIDANGFCPNAGDALCELAGDGTNATECDLTGVDLPYADELDEALETIHATAGEAQAFVFNKLEKFKFDLLETQEMLQDAKDGASNFNWAFQVAAVFAGILLGVTLVIASGIIIAWMKKVRSGWMNKLYSCVRGWFMVPLFTVLVIICWIFSMVFVIGSTVSADMCYNGPDEKLLAFLENNKDQFQDAFYQFATFYVGGCPKEEQPLDLQEKTKEVISFLAPIAVFADEIATANITEFVEVCGDSESLELVQAAAATVREQLCILAQLVIGVRNFLSCDRWHPIYATVAHETMCYNAADGFSYIATCQFIIVFCALVLLTLRSAFYEIREEEDEETRKRCCARFTGPCHRKPEYGEMDDAAEGEEGVAHEVEKGDVAEVEKADAAEVEKADAAEVEEAEVEKSKVEEFEV